METKYKILLIIQKTNNCFKIKPNLPLLKKYEKYPFSNKSGFWKNIKFSKNPEILKEGDFVRFGKKIIRIRFIMLKKQRKRLLKKKKSSKFDFTKIKNFCRFCLTGESFNNLLFSPCKCSGSSKFVHFKCLQKWIKKKFFKDNSENSLSFKLKKFKCELCLKIFKESIKKNKKKYFIINKDFFDPPFICFEEKYKNNKKTKGIHIIKLNKKKIKIGRLEANDIKLKDITVSGYQSIFYLKKNQVYIKDLDSKYGTLIYQNKNLKIFDNLNIQIDDYYFKMKLLKNKINKKQIGRFLENSENKEKEIKKESRENFFFQNYENFSDSSFFSVKEKEDKIVFENNSETFDDDKMAYDNFTLDLKINSINDLVFNNSGSFNDKIV